MKTTTIAHDDTIDHYMPLESEFLYSYAIDSSNNLQQKLYKNKIAVKRFNNASKISRFFFIIDQSSVSAEFIYHSSKR